MLVKTFSGKAKLGALMKGQSWHLAIGEGDPAWGISPPQFDYQDTGLIAPYGVLRARTVSFVEQVAQEPDLVLADQTQWVYSNNPTPFIAASFVLEMSELKHKYLREYALYIGSQFAQDVPLGQNYIDKASVSNFGELIALEAIPEVWREGATRQIFTCVLSF